MRVSGIQLPDPIRPYYGVMGSLFFSCVGDQILRQIQRQVRPRGPIPSPGGDARQARVRGGRPRVEDIGGITPPLPSGRWTLGKIRSVPEDGMLTRCDRMIRRSVKRLRRHGLLRKPVCLAIDFHDICRYDKNPSMTFMRHSKYKNCPRLFNTLATVHCVTGQSRACLGALLRTAEMPKAEMVAALLDMCRKNGIRVGTLLTGYLVLFDRDHGPAGCPGRHLADAHRQERCHQEDSQVREG